MRRVDLSSFIDILRSLFANIPSVLHIEREAYYHSLFYMVLALLGVDFDMEVLTDKGRIDGVLELKDTIYVIEFKYGDSDKDDNMDNLVNKALTQIKERKYYEKYLNKNKRIVLLGIGFLDKEMNYKIEEIM